MILRAILLFVMLKTALLKQVHAQIAEVLCPMFSLEMSSSITKHSLFK